ncbi:RraA-like protein [Ascobolus immersus RN42]|uniref:RraA-like protein n=1 Tax=Ascobolus immersus RN42 TaxID=1160509 RepID=A0A3N4HXC4_ASCIM|nr:RraA-like protein [Ascobolus immersus RN42]
MTSAQIAELSKYTACDLSDGLLKLKLPRAGFLADITLQTSSTSSPIIAPISTVLFTRITSASHTSALLDAPLSAAKSRKQATNLVDPSIMPLAPGAHFADHIAPGSVLFIGSLEGYDRDLDFNALLGGLIALRLSKVGVKGVVVDGRVRDLKELESTVEAQLEGDKTLALQGVWARGRSTVGAGGGHKCVGIGGKVEIDGVVIEEGDICFASDDGVVVVPKGRLDDLLSILPALVDADDKVRGDLVEGAGIAEAFARHRGKL